MTITERLPTAIVVLAVLAAPCVAFAQSGGQNGSQSGAPGATQRGSTNAGPVAATLPNAFGETPPRSARPIANPAPAAAAVSETVVAAQTALRTTIIALQAGAPNYDAMTPGVATRLRQNAATLIPLIQGFGELQAGVHAGTQDGAELFAVAFDRAATEWIIALDEQGRIAVLLFRPAATAPEASTD